MPGTKFDHGESVTNLEVKLVVSGEVLMDRNNLPISEQDYRKYVTYATGLLAGLRNVTLKGYIRSGYRQELPEKRTATLELNNHNVTGLNRIVNMKGGYVNIHYDNGGSDDIGVNENGLYIVSLMKEFNFRRLFG